MKIFPLALFVEVNVTLLKIQLQVDALLSIPALRPSSTRISTLPLYRRTQPVWTSTAENKSR